MINKEPKAIIFDWDDTLAHTRNAVVEAMEYVLRLHNKEAWDITKLKYRDTKKSLKENFPNFFGENSQKAYDEYLHYYQTHSYKKVVSFENSLEFLTLCKSKNIDLYIISNKEKVLLLKEVACCFPLIDFIKILGNGDAKNNKPSSDPVFLALENSEFEINKDNVWLIGDSKQDTECAFNANIQPVLIGKGKFMDDDYVKNKKDVLFSFDNYKELVNFF